VATIVALITALVVARAGVAGGAIVEGVVAGLIAAAVLFCVLRFDPRTVPGYIVASTLTAAAENAALEGTYAGWLAFGTLAAVAILVGYAATRYIGRPLARGAPPDRAAAAPSAT
jgi:hypothetical protein